MDKEFSIQDVPEDGMQRRTDCSAGVYTALWEMAATKEEAMNACITVINVVAIQSCLSLKEMQSFYQQALCQYHIGQENRDNPLED